MLNKVAVVAAAGIATIAVGVGSSSAAPVTPNGFCGALNMVNANALPGMLNAMSRNNPNGDAGMFVAVANSACTS